MLILRDAYTLHRFYARLIRTQLPGFAPPPRQLLGNNQGRPEDHHLSRMLKHDPTVITFKGDMISEFNFGLFTGRRYRTNAGVKAICNLHPDAQTFLGSVKNAQHSGLQVGGKPTTLSQRRLTRRHAGSNHTIQCFLLSSPTSGTNVTV